VAFANDPACRDKARRILIAKYFPAAERAGLYALTGLPVPSDDQMAQDASFQAPVDMQKQGREARFRLRVMAACNCTCALSLYRLTTITGKSIVDAANIHRFADSRNYDLALCKNTNWLFDNGLWTLTDDYKVIVAEGEFAEAGAEQQLLREYHGKTILLPDSRSLRPNPMHIAWHRRKKFRAR
jgi:putative restriction endonuclease